MVEQPTKSRLVNYLTRAAITLVLAEQSVVGVGRYLSSRYQIQHPALVPVFDTDTHKFSIGFRLNTEPNLKIIEGHSGIEAVCADADSIVEAHWAIYKKPENNSHQFAEGIALVARRSMSIPLYWLPKGNYRMDMFYIDGNGTVERVTRNFSVERDCAAEHEKKPDIRI